MKVVIFGAGKYGLAYYKYVQACCKNTEIVSFIDNKKASEFIVLHDIIKIVSPNDINSLDFDRVMIAVADQDIADEMKSQLLKLGIDGEKIDILVEDKQLLHDVFPPQIAYEDTHRRVNWLKNFAWYIEQEQIEGAVAECGVWKGDFAHYINRYFKDRKLYLFDTFEGFNESDLEVERELGDQRFLDSRFNDKLFDNTSIELVMSKMMFPEKVTVKKGLFPNTTEGVDERFAFVNLDMDLYQPTLEGLRFFYPRMTTGGVILCHDYFRYDLQGVKRAIDEYESSVGKHLHKVSVGDYCSIAIVV
jgi:hypothetical protein